MARRGAEVGTNTSLVACPAQAQALAEILILMLDSKLDSVDGDE
jgi:hypothetical protein